MECGAVQQSPSGEGGGDIEPTMAIADAAVPLAVQQVQRYRVRLTAVESR